MSTSFARLSLSLLFVSIAGVAGTAALAQTPPPPPRLEALPDVPPPPKLANEPAADDVDATQVTIRQDGENKIEEFRTRGGRLYAVRVTPRFGKPYLLVDPDGKSTATNASERDGGVKPAQWTIFEF